MAKGVNQQERKDAYFLKVRTLCQTYKKAFVVTVDNVTSSQLHQIRQSLRGKAVVLMGKNTMVRKAIREALDSISEYESLLPLIKGNVGLVFTNDDMKSLRSLILSNRIAAPAKVGSIAQADVYVPAGSTGMPPDKTSFFQALNISTKINKNAIEILNETLLVKTGEKVGPSQAELLGMLNVKPFTYGLCIEKIFDQGDVYEPAVLDITEDSLIKGLIAGIKNVAAISLAIDFPTAASVPHSIINGFKNVLGIALETQYSFPAAEAVKKALSAAPAVSAAPVAVATAAPSKGAPEKKEAKAPVKEEPSEDEDMGFGLFD